MRRSAARQVVILSIAIGLVLLAAALLPRVLAQVGLQVSPRPGYAAPDITLRALAGQTISLSGHKGKPVVLVFVASWCHVCREEMPMMVEAFQAHRPHKVVFLAVDSFEERAAVEKFRDDFKIPFPLLLDTDGAVVSRYNVEGTPTNFFIDRRGTIRDVVVGGPLSRAYLDKEIAPLLETAWK